jgi:tetratricopeptide (TPR) repeat protein
MLDLRRVAPVWVLVSVAALGALVAIRHTGPRFLEAGVVARADACTLAEMRFHAAERLWQELAADALGAAGGERLPRTLGLLAADERVARARDLLEEAAALCPTLQGVHELLADLAWWSGDQARAHYHLGMEHRARGEREYAAVELRAARRLMPKDEDIRALTALLELELGRGNRWLARELLDEAPAGVLDSAVGKWAQARLAVLEGNPSAALELLRAALEREPGRADWIGELVPLLRERGDFESGGDWIMANIAAAPAVDARALHHAAYLYSDGGLYRKALVALERAIALQPNSVLLLVEKGLCHWRLNEMQAARAAMEAAFAKNPAVCARVLEDERFAELRDLRP